MKDFDYRAPTQLADALGELSRASGRAKILAGGTDILVQLREGLREADVVVDIKRIKELQGITQNDQGAWSIGSAEPCSSIEKNAEFCSAYPAVADAVRIIGGWQIKGRATLAGNLCTSSPAADSIPAMIACSTAVEIARIGGVRQVPVEQFCTGPGKNVLQDGEVVTRFHFPPVEKNTSSGYIRFIPRNEMDIAVVGVGVSLQVEGGAIKACRIALGAAAPKPVLAENASSYLIGKPASRESFHEAGRLAREVAKPISDMRSPAEYRIHLVGVLVERCLSLAWRRIQGQQVDPLADPEMRGQ